MTTTQMQDEHSAYGSSVGPTSDSQYSELRIPPRLPIPWCPRTNWDPEALKKHADCLFKLYLQF